MSYPSYEDQKPLMDAHVDAILGDTIRYTPQGGHGRDIQGFILRETEIPQFDGLNPVRTAWYGKVRKTTLAAQPLAGDLFTHTKLGMVPYKPSGDQTHEDPDYWYFELVKA